MLKHVEEYNRPRQIETAFVSYESSSNKFVFITIIPKCLISRNILYGFIFNFFIKKFYVMRKIYLYRIFNHTKNIYFLRFLKYIYCVEKLKIKGYFQNKLCYIIKII